MTISSAKSFEGLAHLKLYYSKVEEIFSVINSGDVLLEAKHLNYFYIHLVKMIDELEEKGNFPKLNQEPPFLYKSLAGNLDKQNNDWEGTKEALNNFLEELDMQLTLAGINEVVYSPVTNEFITRIDDAIKKHESALNENRLTLEVPDIYKSMFTGDQERSPENKRQSHSFFEWVVQRDLGRLIIDNCDPIEFDGDLRVKIINYFYNSRGDGSWKSYQDIQRVIGDKYTANDINKAITKINQRIHKETHQKLGEIIESDQTDRDSKKPKKYRWKS